MSFASPLLLLCLAAVPLAVLLLVRLDRHRERRAAAWAPATLLPNMVTRPSPRRRLLPTAFLLVGAALLLVGFARPKASFHVPSQEATLLLVLDVSGSMAANDVQPSRLAVAKAIARRYVDRVPKGYRVGLLTFSDHVAVEALPTHDLDAVRGALANARSGPQGTALAAAAARAVQVGATVRGSVRGKRPPAVVVILSDGGQTAGNVTPQQAVQRARQAGIPISTILVGTPDGVVQQKIRGGYTERFQVPAQPQLLQLLAGQSGGRFVPGPQALDVGATYDELGSRVGATYDELGSRVGSRRKTVEVSAVAAAGGLVFMLTGGLLSGAWFRRIP